MKKLLIAVVVVLAVALVPSVSAQTHISAEPIPTGDVVGDANLDKILSIGFSNLETWSERVLKQCSVVDNIIAALDSNGAIRTITPRNTSVEVEAGGFEAVTNPSYVFTIRDTGSRAASASDIAVLDNAVGYVLSQGGTARFSPNNPNANDFPLDYAVVSFARHLSGLEAKAFFDFVGTIDPALWSGPLAGFTQIDNSMLFLQPDVSKEQFVTGLSDAARRYPWATYETLDKRGKPTTATAGVAFAGNDWIQFPEGDQYLANLSMPSRRLLRELASLRQQHLRAVADLLKAIERRNLRNFLGHDFKCPR